MRTKLLVVSLLVVASLLAACGSFSPTTASAPVATQTARVVVVTATPQATETLAPTLVPTNTPMPPTATISPTATKHLYEIPLTWFSNQGLDFKKGVSVAYKCETGARAWQGTIPFTTVPTDASIELVEVNCIQYKPGEVIPQAELNKMKGQGTIWFTMHIEGTENQKGDCSCQGSDC